MPPLKDVLDTFGNDGAWRDRGDEWSFSWGSAALQWLGAIQPRIYPFLPARTVVEIAPGFGRWTQFLAPLCDNLVAVDVAANCIEHCKKRFADRYNIHYFVNDGLHLNMVGDRSVDLVFSYDSLVHMEIEILGSYINEVSRVLRDDGVAFLHHSNLGNFNREGAPKELGMHWRAGSVTYQKVKEVCEQVGLRCITQETVNWGLPPQYQIDCMSLICRRDSYPQLPYRLYENGQFMDEAEGMRRIYLNYFSPSSDAPAVSTPIDASQATSTRQ